MLDKLILKTCDTAEGDVVITIMIPRSDLFWFTENQIQMIHMAQGKTIIDQLRIIFIMILEVLSRGNKHA